MEIVFLKDRLRYIYALEAEWNRLLRNGCDKETRKFFKRCIEMIKLKQLYQKIEDLEEKLANQ